MFDAKAIVFGCDNVNGLTVIRSLGRRGVPVVAVGYHHPSLGFYSRYTGDKWVFPDPIQDEEEFISSLMRNGKKFGGALLFPAGDAELEAMSKHRAELSEHYIVPVPSWNHAQKMVDKRGQYELASSLNIGVPKTFYVKCKRPPWNVGREMEFPVLLKPRKSMFSSKFGFKAKIANNPEQLEYLLAGLFSADEMMVQELIPGPESLLHYYVGYYNPEGVPVAEFTNIKIRQIPPLLGIARVIMSTHTREIIEISRKIASALCFKGLCGIEYKMDPRDGKFKLIDFNGRSPLLVGLPIRCGIDFPWIMYSDMVLEKRPPVPEYPDGIYWIDEWGELMCLIRYRRLENIKLSEYVKPYLGEKVFAVAAIDDPMPTFATAFSYIKNKLK